MELIINALVILASVYLGYLMGQGKEINILPKKLKRIIRTPEQEASFERALAEHK